MPRPVSPGGPAPIHPSRPSAPAKKQQQQPTDFKKVAENVNQKARSILKNAPLIRPIEGKALKTKNDDATKVFAKTQRHSQRGG